MVLTFEIASPDVRIAGILTFSAASRSHWSSPPQIVTPAKADPGKDDSA